VATTFCVASKDYFVLTVKKYSSGGSFGSSGGSLVGAVVAHW
jgi:hypothetical protein